MPYASDLETEAKRCPQRYQSRSAWAAWVRRWPSTLRHDPKTDELARSSRRRAQSFLLSHSSREDNWACLPGMFCNSGRKGATRSMQVIRRRRTRNCSRSLNLTPNSKASEHPPSTSQGDSREDRKQSPSLVPDTAPFETEKGHRNQEDCEGPYGILYFQPWGLIKVRKGISQLMPSCHVRRLGSAQVSLCFSELVVLQILGRWQQTCLWSICLLPPPKVIWRDRWSATQWFLRREYNR